jgi:hypothetical protein
MPATEGPGLTRFLASALGGDERRSVQDLLADTEMGSTREGSAVSRVDDRQLRCSRAARVKIGPWIGRAGRPRLLRFPDGESRRPQTYVPGETSGRTQSGRQTQPTAQT